QRVTPAHLALTDHRGTHPHPGTEANWSKETPPPPTALVAPDEVLVEALWLWSVPGAVVSPAVAGLVAS
ncbi:hypothetical protein U6L75_05635, partial [Cutibacterium acnes]